MRPENLQRGIIFIFALIMSSPSAGVSQDITLEIRPYIPETVLLRGGAFSMGSDKGEEDERPVHSVTLRDFYIGKYEVMQCQWEALMGFNPSHFKGDSLPVEHVSYKDVEKYLNRLSKLTGEKYRLPTEAEWEYACKGKLRTEFSFGDNPDDIGRFAVYRGNTKRRTSKTGSKLANPFGLFDMHGNVWEWCSDWYGKDYYRKSPETEPKGPRRGLYRVIRGGAWTSSYFEARSSYRLFNYQDDRNYNVGFRAVKEID